MVNSKVYIVVPKVIAALSGKLSLFFYSVSPLFGFFAIIFIFIFISKCCKQITAFSVEFSRNAHKQDIRFRFVCFRMVFVSSSVFKFDEVKTSAKIHYSEFYSASLVVNKFIQQQKHTVEVVSYSVEIDN